jgi:hypothetical protein
MPTSDLHVGATWPIPASRLAVAEVRPSAGRVQILNPSIAAEFRELLALNVASVELWLVHQFYSKKLLRAC